MIVKVRKILKKLKDDGWIQVRQKGSHRQFKHPILKGTVTINGSLSDDIDGDLLKSIEKQSGLKF